MKKLLSLFSVLFLYGCTYTDVYVHEDTEVFSNIGLERNSNIVNALEEFDLILYPNFRRFRPGYDDRYALLGIFSKEPVSIHVSNVKFVNLDTGSLHEYIVNETLTTFAPEDFRGNLNLDFYGSGTRISGEEIYQDIYGAMEIEMTVFYSVNGRSIESKTFKLKRVTDVSFILGAV